MTLYRPKHVVVEARLLTRDNFYAVGDWAGADECWELEAPLPELRFDAPEGFRRAHLGDYVIRDAMGGCYPCPAGFFAAMYEEYHG